MILNTAAYTLVDGAEDHPETAHAVNTFAVESLARQASEIGAKLIHFSTDFVFERTGPQNAPAGRPPKTLRPPLTLPLSAPLQSFPKTL